MAGMAISAVIPHGTAFFDTVMALTISASVVLAGGFYLRKNNATGFAAGLRIGGIWMGLSLALDAPFFLIGGPMKMTPYAYFTDIGLTYAMMPIIMAGLAAAPPRK